MTNPKLNQKQREAIADILVLAMCIDGHFSLNEDEKFQEKIENLGWEPDSSPSHYLSLSLARARDVAESPEKVQNYLKNVAPLLKEPELKVYILQKTEKLLGSDGFKPEEGVFLAQLKAVLV